MERHGRSGQPRWPRNARNWIQRREAPIAQENAETQYTRELEYAISNNDAEAITWYCKAAEQGNKDTQNELRGRGLN
jgi:TPR repeat protein